MPVPLMPRLGPEASLNLGLEAPLPDHARFKGALTDSRRQRSC